MQHRAGKHGRVAAGAYSIELPSLMAAASLAPEQQAHAAQNCQACVQQFQMQRGHVINVNSPANSIFCFMKSSIALITVCFACCSDTPLPSWLICSSIKACYGRQCYH